jgi:signal transduction histidine kinase
MHVELSFISFSSILIGAYISVRAAALFHFFSLSIDKVTNSMLFVDPVLIILAIAATANLVMLIAVLRIHGLRTGIMNEGATQVLLLVYVIGSVGWIAFQMLHRLQALNLIVGFDLFILERIALYFLLVLAVVFFQLTRVFQRKSGPGWLGWLGGLAFLVVAAVLYENPLALPDTLAALPFGSLVIMRWLVAFAITIAGWAVFMGMVVLLTMRNYRETASPLHRNRINYWSMAVILAIIGEGLYLTRLSLAGNLLRLLAQGICVYVLMTHNLPDLRMALRRSASYLVMLIVTVAVYTGGFYAIQLIFKNVPGYSPLVAGAVLAFALAVLFNPLLGIVQRFVSRLITGAHYDSRQTLSEYSMSISNILDMEVLATVVVGLISEAMEITHGALVTVNHEPGLFAGDSVFPGGSGSYPDGSSPASNIFINGDEVLAGEGERYLLRSISGLGQEMPEGHISAKNPVAFYLRREHCPLLQYDIDLQPRFHIMEPAEREWLAGLDMDVFVPIYTKDRWIGLLALGAKTSGDRYYDEDLGLLQTLADQTAVALENARLFEDVKLRNMENERLNEELKTANAELARLDRAKSDFINIASHELRTPLTQVIGYNDILGEMIKGDELQPAVGVQMVDSVRRAARRLEEIVETMFDVSKLDTKTLDLMRAPVSLSAVITVAIDTWAKGLEERKQTVSVRGLATLPTIVADGKRLTQVFSHLIQNAVKSTPDGGQIRVSGRVVMATNTANTANSFGERIEETDRFQKSISNLMPAELAPITGSGGDGSQGQAAAGGAAEAGMPGAAGDTAKASSLGDGALSSSASEKTGERFIEIVIADTGIGIASDDLERIFEKFYRVGNVLLHSTGDTKFKGAGPGLGLTIARGIVEAHGGRIWAESPGHDEEHCPGSKFHVLLPIRTNMNQPKPAKSR